MSTKRSLLDARFVSAALAEAGLRARSAQPLQLERGWPLPKVPVMALYSDPEAPASHPRWWSLHAVGAGRPSFAYRRALEQGHGVFVESLQSIVLEFPEDLLLRHIPTVADSDSMLDCLGALIAPRNGGWSHLTTRIIAYKPTRRCMVRYRLHEGGGQARTLYGKCFPPEVDGEQWQIHKTLEQTSQKRPFEHLDFAHPAGRIERWNMLWWTEQPGQSLHELLGSAGWIEVAGCAGRALADLHGSETPWIRSHGRRHETATLHTWIEAALHAAPDGNTISRELEKRVRARLLASPPTRLVPSHRDFYDKQILWHRGAVTLLDLETAAMAEPELDIANFLAHLELRAAQGCDLAVPEARRAFLEGYAEGGQYPEPERLVSYLASTFLRLACVYTFRPRWRELPARMSKAAESTLTARCASRSEESWR